MKSDAIGVDQNKDILTESHSGKHHCCRDEARLPSHVMCSVSYPTYSRKLTVTGTLFWKGHHRVPSEESTNVYTATSLFPCAWLYFLSSPTEAFPVSQESCSTSATGQILGWMGAAVCYSIFRCFLVLSLSPSRYL